VIIPASVIQMLGKNNTMGGNMAFGSCTGLAKVTFQGIFITFAPSPFPGDLDKKYLEGGMGTYTTANPGYTAVWTKQ
jgi:hypothetical protein